MAKISLDSFVLKHKYFTSKSTFNSTQYEILIRLINMLSSSALLGGDTALVKQMLKRSSTITLT